MPGRPVPWTMEEHQTVLRLKAEGKSFEYIAKQLPGRTRRAISSRLEREAHKHNGNRIIDLSEANPAVNPEARLNPEERTTPLIAGNNAGNLAVNQYDGAMSSSDPFPDNIPEPQWMKDLNDGESALQAFYHTDAPAPYEFRLTSADNGDFFSRLIAEQNAHDMRRQLDLVDARAEPMDMADSSYQAGQAPSDLNELNFMGDHHQSYDLDPFNNGLNRMPSSDASINVGSQPGGHVYPQQLHQPATPWHDRLQWSAGEDIHLLLAMENPGETWTAVASKLNRGPQQCEERYRNLNPGGPAWLRGS